MKCGFARSLLLAGAVAASAWGGAAHAEDLTTTIKLANVASNTYLDWQGNTILEFSLGHNVHINGLSWDVTITALPGSFMSEAYMTFGDSSNWNRLALLPSELAQPNGGFYSGTTRFTGSVDLRHMEFPAETGDYSFDLKPDGILRLQFAENSDDLEGADAIWKSATFTFNYSVSPVPEPASYAMMLLGLGAVAGVARRRKRSAV